MDAAHYRRRFASTAPWWTRLGAVAVTLLVSLNTPAEEAVAILDLKFVEDTGETGAVLCLDDGEDCFQWATYYIFEARVREVITGDLPDEPFEVLFARHALRKDDFNDVMAILEPREDAGPDEPAYRILEWGARRNIYCIPMRDDENVDSDDESTIDFMPFEKLNCYDPENWSD